MIGIIVIYVVAISPYEIYVIQHPHDEFGDAFLSCYFAPVFLEVMIYADYPVGP
jgi:hypothetical protein